MARAEHELFQVDRAVAEGALRHGLGGADDLGEPGGLVDPAHPDAAAASRGLHQQRVAHGLGGLVDAGKVCRRDSPTAGKHGEAGGLGQRTRALLVAHGGDAVRPRADPDEAGVLHGLREGGVLGEEAIARMDAVGAAPARSRDDPVGDEVALLRSRRADGQRLVGLGDMARGGVGFRMNRDHAHAERPCAPHDPAGDLAPVRDQEFLHGHRARGRAGGYPPAQGAASAVRGGRPVRSAAPAARTLMLRVRAASARRPARRCRR